MPTNATALAAPTARLALTTALGAALLFLVQPLVGRALLPSLGGAPAVWVTCLVFFQGALVLAYLWVHLLATRCSVRTQCALQATLLALVLARGPAAVELPSHIDPAHPVIPLLVALARSVGPAYLLLATTAPLLQRFWSLAGAPHPHRLYALSNAGALAGLLAYPLAMEPLLTLRAQRLAWFAGVALYGLSLAPTLFSFARSRISPAPAPSPEPTSKRSDGPLPWVVLPACANALLVAVSEHVTTDLAPGPLLWSAPLALFLLAWALAFRAPSLARSELLSLAWVLCTLALGVLLAPGMSGPLPLLLGAPLATLFVGSLRALSLLAASRPAPERSTLFYLCISVGGALGGGAVGLLAPRVFAERYELALVLLALHALFAYDALRARAREDETSGSQRIAWLGLGLAMPVLLGALYVDAAGLGRGGALLQRSRSFFGPLYVVETRSVRTLRHGRTTHGVQPRAPEHANEPGAYYGAHTPFARALRTHGAERPRSIGVVGLGVGSAAAYARERDSLRFYEIDADVERAARGWFGFLRGTPARTSVAIGDGRISLARDEGALFDVLVLDAFSSDAVPTHLLTREAFALYLRHLAPDGVLLAHVSNRHVAVERAVAGAAADLGLAFALFETPADPSRFATRARWAAVARTQDPLRGLEGAPTVALPPPPPVRWTDERSSVLSLLGGR